MHTATEVKLAISLPECTWRRHLQLSESPSISNKTNLLLMFAMEMGVFLGSSYEQLKFSILLADHTLLYELLNVIGHLGPKYSVPCPKEAVHLALVAFMYVLEHFWSHLPWNYDPVPTSNEA